MTQALNNHDILGRDVAARKAVANAINTTLGTAGYCTYRNESGRWGIVWQNAPDDPFTDEQPQTQYETAGQCLDAAVSAHN